MFYSYEWSGMAAGTYSLTAVATDNNGETATSTAVSIKVNAAPKTIKLKAGWNMIGCPISGSTEIAKALSSIWQNVLVVKNFDGFYDKSAGALNSLLNVEYSKGYYVKVSVPCELDWIVR
ncbi:MAG: hypothetical protein IPO21_16695 [Bacteroidales bacterium]|nr:hypothetical protein [Bacteroidales bacterium]